MAAETSRRTEWLVLRAQSGDRRALEDLLALTQQTLRPYVASMAEGDSVSEVVQEVLVTIYRKLGQLREPRAFLAWAHRIASRVLLAQRRRQARIAATHLPIEEAMPLAADADGTGEDWDEELAAALPGLLRRVSPASREVLSLHYESSLSLDDIAAVLDLPVGTVKSRLAYGLRSLRRLLQETGRTTHGRQKV